MAPENGAVPTPLNLPAGIAKCDSHLRSPSAQTSQNSMMFRHHNHAVNVGIASRLVQQEPFPPWMSPLTEGFTMTAGSPDHHGLSLGYISEPQQIPPVFSFPPQVFFPAPFQIIPQNNSLSAHQHRIPLPPGIDSMAVHGVPGMYLSPQAWSKSTVRNPTLPSVIGPHYPLHHLTGSGFVLMQPSPCSDARISDLPDGTGQACTPNSTVRLPVPRHPLSYCRNLEDVSSSTTSPLESLENNHNRVYRAQAVDGIDDALPQDLSVRSLDDSGYNAGEETDEPTLELPKLPNVCSPQLQISPLHLPSFRPSGRDFYRKTPELPSIDVQKMSWGKKPQSEMEEAAKEWQKVSINDDIDCWSFLLTNFKPRRNRYDRAYVETRSAFSKMPLHFRNVINFSQPKNLSRCLLHALKLSEFREETESCELPVEAADVDPCELRKILDRLMEVAPLGEITFPDDGAAVLLLNSVGLVEKCDSSISFSAEKSSQPSIKSSRTNTAARQAVKKKLRATVVDLSLQITRLRKKVKSVKKLIKDEALRDDAGVALLDMELKNILRQ